MPNVVVAESHLTFGGIKYFRGGAATVRLLDTGDKRTPVFGQNYLEPKGSIPAGKVNVVQSGVVEIDFNTTSKSAFGASVPIVAGGVPLKVSGAAGFDRMRSGELKLVLFSVKINDLVDAVNGSPEVKRNLIDWGNDARVVHQAFYVMEATLARQFANNGSVDVAVGVKGLEAKVGGGTSNSGGTTVTLAKDSCFAYLLARMEWDAKSAKKITRAIDAKSDPWSI